jgi:hypothetical protein
MERQAKKRHLPFLTAKAKAQQLYAVDMKEDDFVEMAYDIWRSIGNIATKISRYYVNVPNDLILELPMQAEFIESVTIVNEKGVIDSFDSQGYKDRNVYAYQERSNLPQVNQSISKSNGKAVNYITLDNNSIKVTSPDALNRDVMIVYRMVDNDEDGLPLLNDKEVEAIAAEVAKRDLTRKLFQGVGLKDKTGVTLLQFITAEAARLMTAAKIDENITDDALDKLLDIRTSFDRKLYNRRFNFIN